jgi:hypothetical protein
VHPMQVVQIDTVDASTCRPIRASVFSCGARYGKEGCDAGYGWRHAGAARDGL